MNTGIAIRTLQLSVCVCMEPVCLGHLSKKSSRRTILIPEGKKEEFFSFKTFSFSCQCHHAFCLVCTYTHFDTLENFHCCKEGSIDLWAKIETCPLKLADPGSNFRSLQAV